MTIHATSGYKSADELEEEFGGTWGEHPDYSAEQWRWDVSNGDTRSGYWTWVAAQVESAA